MKLQTIFKHKKHKSIFKDKPYLDNFLNTKNPKMFIPKYGGGYYGIDQTTPFAGFTPSGDAGGGDGGGGA